MKKWMLLAVTLLGLLCAALLGGCHAGEGESVPTLNIYLTGTEDAGVALVNEALSRYTMEKLGVRAQLVMSSNYSATLEQDLKDGKQIDIAFCSNGSTVSQFRQDGLLTPLDDLLETKGSDIYGVLNPDYYEFSRIDGSLYALPTNRERYWTVGFEYNQELAEQYDLDFSTVHSREDLTAIFEKLHNQTDEIYPTVVVPGFIQFDQVDRLGNSLGVLTGDSGTTVVNLYEAQDFRNLITLIHEWREKGYMLDYSQDGGVISFYLSSGKVLGCLTIGKVGFEAQENRICGHRIGFVPLAPAYIASSRLDVAWYAIPTTTIDAEKAMELLNLMYTDPYLANLIMYGIEGVHYERVEPEGNTVHLGNCTAPGTYYHPYGYYYCNQYIASLWEGYDEDIWEQTEQMNREAIRTPAWGFRFDSSPVAEQVYRCESVTDYYLNSLYAGTVDPDKTLDSFLAALKTAGIDQIIAEKQRQLDLFLQEAPQ